MTDRLREALDVLARPHVHSFRSVKEAAYYVAAHGDDSQRRLASKVLFCQ